MPAGMVRPRASLVSPLGADAIAAYIAAGWRLSEGGRIEIKGHIGPCAICREAHVRYGLTGSPLCPQCRRDRTERRGGAR